MLATRIIYSWLTQPSSNSRPYSGPVRGALVLPDGSLIPFDLTDSWTTRTLLNTDHGAIAHVTLTPATGEWGGTAMNPVTRCFLYSAGLTAEDAAAGILVLLAESGVETAREAAEPAYRARRLLERMDWYSHMSDDHSAWEAGERDMRALRGALGELSLRDARAIWASYAPADTTCPI